MFIFHLIISRARVWKTGAVPAVPHCPLLVRAGAAGNLHSALPGQMDYGSQMYLFFIGMKRVRDSALVHLRRIWSEREQREEIIAIPLSPQSFAIAESQLYIFNMD